MKDKKSVENLTKRLSNMKDKKSCDVAISMKENVPRQLLLHPATPSSEKSVFSKIIFQEKDQRGPNCKMKSSSIENSSIYPTSSGFRLTMLYSELLHEKSDRSFKNLQ